MRRSWLRTGMLLSAVMLGVASAGRVEAQAPVTAYEPADIEYGEAVYRTECASCHGETGDGAPPADLGSGRFRRAVTDRDLRRLIREGIPGTTMPAFELDPAESAGVVAYLRNMNFEGDRVTLGDPSRGRILFEERGECATCHRVAGRGPRVAPELTSIGAQRAPSALRRSLLDPSGSMRPINRPVVVVTADGQRVTGRRLNEDTYTVQLIDEQERLWSVDKADLREYSIETESPMPSYADRLTPDELADVLAYLVSLKG